MELRKWNYLPFRPAESVVSVPVIKKRRKLLVQLIRDVTIVK